MESTLITWMFVLLYRLREAFASLTEDLLRNMFPDIELGYAKA